MSALYIVYSAHRPTTRLRSRENDVELSASYSRLAITHYVSDWIGWIGRSREFLPRWSKFRDLATTVFMAALRSKCGHYILALWFLLSVFLFLTYSQPSQIGCLPYFHTWCGLSANLGCGSAMCCPYIHVFHFLNHTLGRIIKHSHRGR